MIVVAIVSHLKIFICFARSLFNINRAVGHVQVKINPVLSVNGCFVNNVRVCR